MDSLSQLVLGAAVGGAVAGRRFGRKALVWGALCGTLPDLDVLVPLGDPVSDFTYHRSASHSLLMQLLATPLLTWSITRVHPDTAPGWPRWAALVYLALATHALLDAFTVYGTQLLWPLDPTPFGLGSIFIIDPLYTVPLTGAVVVAAVARDGERIRRASLVGIVLSSAYLAWTVAAQVHVGRLARESLADAAIDVERLLVTPTPFNSVLWRVLAIGPESYHEGFRSLLDDDGPIDFDRHPRHPELLAPIADAWPVARLMWFTRGFHAAAVRNQDVVLTDLRMGLEPDYVFAFRVGVLGNPHVHPAEAIRLPARRDFGRVARVWRRIFDARVRP